MILLVTCPQQDHKGIEHTHAVPTVMNDILPSIIIILLLRKGNAVLWKIEVMCCIRPTVQFER